MKMYVAGGEIRVEDSAEFNVRAIVFDVRAYFVKQPCQAAKPTKVLVRKSL